MVCEAGRFDPRPVAILVVLLRRAGQEGTEALPCSLLARLPDFAEAGCPIRLVAAELPALQIVAARPAAWRLGRWRCSSRRVEAVRQALSPERREHPVRPAGAASDVLRFEQETRRERPRLGSGFGAAFLDLLVASRDRRFVQPVPDERRGAGFPSQIRDDLAGVPAPEDEPTPLASQRPVERLKTAVQPPPRCAADRLFALLLIEHENGDDGTSGPDCPRPRGVVSQPQVPPEPGENRSLRGRRHAGGAYGS